MKKNKISFVCLFAVVIFSSATLSGEEGYQSSYDIGLSIRKDHGQWTIAGFDTPVLSDLDWTSLDIIELRGSADYFFSENFFLNFQLALGKMHSGKNRDSDYANDNGVVREALRTYADTKGQTFDFSIGLGMKYKLDEKFDISPVIGYSYHRQDHTMTNGTRVLFNPYLFDIIDGVDDDGYPNITETGTVPFSGLNSTYDASWSGIYFGAKLEYEHSKKLRFSLLAQYHSIDYRADQHWNLFNRNFSNEADAKGYQLELKAIYKANPKYDFWVGLSYLSFDSDRGTQTQDGRVINTINEAVWESFRFSAGIKKEF